MLWQSVVLLVGLAVAVVWDVRSRRIPNALTLSLALAGLVIHSAQGGFYGAFVSLQGLLVGLAFFVVPFAVGGLGGGDVKLAMAAGALTGPQLAFYTVIYGALAGGVIATGILVTRGRFLRTCRDLVRGAWLSAASGAWVGPAQKESIVGGEGRESEVVGTVSEEASQESEGSVESAVAAGRAHSFPYAVAIASGAVLALWLAPVGY